MNAPVVPVPLTITVLDTATIFEGPDTVYRYDLPGTGIRDGWALAAVIDQAKELCSLDWPDVEIIIDADEPIMEVLTRTLLNKGVASYPSEALRETELPRTEDPPEVTRPTRRVLPSLGEVVASRPLLIGAGTVVAVGLIWWGIDLSTAESAPSAPSAPGTVSPAAQEAAPEPTPTSETPTVTETSASREPELLEGEGLRVELPAGFRLEPHDGALLATGEDPDLRIHIAADPVYTVPAVEVEARVHEMIAADATLQPLDTEQIARGVETIRYRELPGDDSQVTWTTWIESGHQMSVGCHTRHRPTVPQEAACRMALNSMQLADPTAPVDPVDPVEEA